MYTLFLNHKRTIRVSIFSSFCFSRLSFLRHLSILPALKFIVTNVFINSSYILISVRFIALWSWHSCYWWFFFLLIICIIDLNAFLLLMISFSFFWSYALLILMQIILSKIPFYSWFIFHFKDLIDFYNYFLFSIFLIFAFFPFEMKTYSKTWTSIL